jgi:hypothetical protein
MTLALAVSRMVVERHEQTKRRGNLWLEKQPFTWKGMKRRFRRSASCCNLLYLAMASMFGSWMFGLTKYDNEIRTGRNVKQLTHRALQIATSDPKVPVYLMGAREVMEEALEAPVPIDRDAWRPVPPLPLPEDAAAEILAAFTAASPRRGRHGATLRHAPAEDGSSSEHEPVAGGGEFFAG